MKTAQVTQLNPVLYRLKKMFSTISNAITQSLLSFNETCFRVSEINALNRKTDTELSKMGLMRRDIFRQTRKNTGPS